ncbi:MAG: hypothetical protein NZ483_04970 [Verrucomicrobiae bacterium]|nr:hypothetical protein [Verrucomicrobiae bacterium]
MRCAIVTLAVCGLVALAYGQDTTRPRIAGVTIGMNGLVRNRAWASLVAHLENSGPAATVRLRAQLTGHSTGQILHFEYEFPMPARARRHVEFPVWVDVAIPVQDPVGVRPICDVILFDAQDRELGRTDAMAMVLSEEVFLVGTADSRTISYRFWMDRTSPVNRRPFARMVMTPERLPRRPLSLQMFDAIVLGDLGAAQLTPLQVRALSDWVERGGTLVALPGATRGDDAVWEWMPADFSEVEVVETLPELVGETHLAGGVALARCRVRPGSEVWWGTPDNPLVTARRKGLGAVVALAFDFGADDLQSWSGAFDFWQQLWARCPQPFRYAQPLLERSGALDDILPAMAGVRVVERRTVSRYVLATVVALGGLVAVLWFRGRGEWGWFVALIVAVGLTVGAVTAAAIWKTQGQASWNELYFAVQRHGDTAVAQVGALGVYSPRELTLEFGSDDDRMEWRPAPRHTVPPEVFAARYDDGLQVSRFRVRADDIRSLMMRSASTTTEPPWAIVRLDSDGLGLRTSVPVAMQDAVLKWNRFVVPLGDLSAQRTQDWSGLQENVGRYSQRLMRRSTDELRDRFRQVLFPDPVFGRAMTFHYDRVRWEGFFRTTERAPVVFGWTELGSASSASAPPDLTRRSLGMWLVEAGVETGSDEIRLPAGVLEMQLLNRAAVTLRVGDGQFQGNRAAEIIAEFRLPVSCPDLVLTEAVVHVEFRGNLYRPAVWVAPAKVTGDDWRPNTWPSCPGGPTYRIESPQQFYRPATRSMVVALTIDPIPAARQADALTLGLNEWQVRRFELELRGRRAKDIP